MCKVKDITGKKFHRLTAIKRVGSNKEGRAIWLCKCDCGKEIVVSGVLLRNGAVKSCGCLQLEKLAKAVKKHGLTNHRLYNIYTHIKQRCNNPNCKQYIWYGAKGIKIYSEWNKNFETFYEWSINNGYQDDLTIDRIDVNGNYEPANCRWVDMKVQQNNRGNNHNVTINGVKHTLSEWARINNISIHTIRNRLARKWSDIEAVSTPINRRRLKINANTD